MADLVLDAWAVMVWLKGQQPAADRMRALLEAADRRECRLTMNIVNVGEVFYVCVKARNVAYGQRVLETLQPRVATVSAHDELVMLAATLKARHAISYADGFAAATAMLQHAPLVTGDPEIRAMAAKEKALQLEWIDS
ncbi:MAG: type II toxin-antitoxin system VapC family toxin [Candidatus Korobacteraceae bacterium]|jgi:predicted nucleic acid-binding protein